MRGTLFDRFEAKVDRSGGPDACHPWLGATGRCDQPSIMHQKRNLSARRIAWEVAHGAPPGPKQWLRVTCGNQRCLNPKHIALRSIHLSVERRLWSKVDRSGGPGACWPFTGERRKGYGVVKLRSFRRPGKSPHHERAPAHRVAWEVTHGPIPDGLLVCHRCDNPPCCNPAHHFLGTNEDNIRDKVSKGRHRPRAGQ